MASGTFEKTSIGWQFQQLSQQVGEWFEGLFPDRASNRPALPTLPEWLIKSLFWFIVVAAIAWVGWQFYQQFGSNGVFGWRQSQPIAASDPEMTVAQWLQQAGSAHQQGDYREACRLLYMAALQRLSDRGLIPQLPSRTDGEYLSLVRSLSLPPPYQVLIRAHERLFFDRVTASAALYDRCWQAYQEIEQT